MTLILLSFNFSLSLHSVHGYALPSTVSMVLGSTCGFSNDYCGMTSAGFLQYGTGGECKFFNRIPSQTKINRVLRFITVRLYNSEDLLIMSKSVALYRQLCFSWKASLMQTFNRWQHLSITVCHLVVKIMVIQGYVCSRNYWNHLLWMSFITHTVL